MPKEVIYDTHYSDDNDAAAEGSGFKVEVKWFRGTELMQVATTAHDGERNGFHVTLDRGGVNRMIRALRKGRDQAFGSDA